MADTVGPDAIPRQRRQTSGYPPQLVTEAPPPIKPPPPPPRRPGGPPPPPPRARPNLPAPGQTLTEGDKQALALRALGLMNEQIQARIVHYRGDLETNSELDAITAQVVAQLKAVQGSLSPDGPAFDPEPLEAKHADSLVLLLTKLLSGERQASFVTQVLKPVGRRLAKLFFESELHERTKADKERKIYHAEQGIFYLLQRYKNRLHSELEGFDYESDEIRAQTLETLNKFERDMQVAFLSRRSPELNRVMEIFAAVLRDFLCTHLPTRLAPLAKITVRAAKTGSSRGAVDYKILAQAFPDFRREWEQRFMEQMVNFCEDELMGRLSNSDEPFRDETMAFFVDPQIFSATCQVVCELIYDSLFMEGFLDLPTDWRVSMRDKG